jgi:TPR repeat protein
MNSSRSIGISVSPLVMTLVSSGAIFGAPATLPDAAVSASDDKQCAVAYDNKDFSKAFELCQPLADKGDADAQAKVGIMYVTGRGVAQEYAQALAWFRRAADQGNPTAQFYIGW